MLNMFSQNPTIWQQIAKLQMQMFSQTTVYKLNWQNILYEW